MVPLWIGHASILNGRALEITHTVPLSLKYFLVWMEKGRQIYDRENHTDYLSVIKELNKHKKKTNDITIIIKKNFF